MRDAAILHHPRPPRLRANIGTFFTCALPYTPSSTLSTGWRSALAFRQGLAERNCMCRTLRPPLCPRVTLVQRVVGGMDRPAFFNVGTGSDFTPVYAYSNVLINLEEEEKDLEIKNDDCEKVCLADFLGT